MSSASDVVMEAGEDPGAPAQQQQQQNLFGMEGESAEDAAKRARGVAMQRQASVFVEDVEARLRTNEELESLRSAAQQEGPQAGAADERLLTLTKSWGFEGSESRYLSNNFDRQKRTFDDLTAGGRRRAKRRSLQRSNSRWGSPKNGDRQAFGAREEAAGVQPLLRQISWFGPTGPAGLLNVGSDDYAKFDVGDESSDDDVYVSSDSEDDYSTTAIHDPYEAGARHRALVLLPDPKLKSEDIFADVAALEKERLEEAGKHAKAQVERWKARQQAGPGGGRGRGAGPAAFGAYGLGGFGGGFGAGAGAGAAVWVPGRGWVNPADHPEQGQGNKHVMMVDVSFPYGGRPQRLQKAKRQAQWGSARPKGKAARNQRRFVVPDILLNTANHPEALDALPRDIIVDILLRLPLRDTVSLSEVSRHCHECASGDLIWLHHLKRDYSDFVMQNKLRLEKKSGNGVGVVEDSLPQVVSTHFSRTSLRNLYAALSRQYVSVLGIPINDTPARVKEISDPVSRARQASRNETNGIAPFFVLHQDVSKSRNGNPMWRIIEDHNAIFGKCLLMGESPPFEILKIAGSCVVNVPGKYQVMWRLRVATNAPFRWGAAARGGASLDGLAGATFTTTTHAPAPVRGLVSGLGKEISRIEFKLDSKNQQLMQAGRATRSNFSLLSVGEVVISEPGVRVGFEMFSDGADSMGELHLDCVRLYPMSDHA